MFTQRHIRYVKRFAPFATGPNLGSSDFIGSLRGQSEMTLNGMSSDPHNGVNSLDHEIGQQQTWHYPSDSAWHHLTFR